MMRVVPVRAISAILALLWLLLSGCCTSKEQGEALRKDVDTLKRKLTQDIEQSEQERKKLQKIMEQATALLTRNSADVGAQVDRIQAKVDRLVGQSEEQQKKLNDLNQQFTEYKAKVDVKLEGLASGTTNKNPPVPQDKDELFNQAKSKLDSGEHKEARRLLRHFLSRFAGDRRVHKAQLMLGDSYYVEQKFANAIVEYKKIVEQHKRSPTVPDALFKIGMAFYQLKFCSDAKLFFRQYLKRYSRHKHARRTRKILRLIRRYKKNPKVCR
jgi:TolA-binding protein